MNEEKKTRPAPEALDVLANLSSMMPCDEAAQKKWPTICKFMLPSFKEKVCVRQGASFSVKAEGTYWRITVVCATERVQATLLVESLVDLFAQIEAFLRDPKTHWTPTWESQKRSRPVIDALL